MSESEIPGEVLDQIRETERRVRTSGDWVRRARDEMRLCAGEYEQLDRIATGEQWYSGGLSDEAQRLRDIVSELDIIVMDLEERGW